MVILRKYYLFIFILQILLGRQKQSGKQNRPLDVEEGAFGPLPSAWHSNSLCLRQTLNMDLLQFFQQH
jgi:hypothetical protein